MELSDLYSIFKQSGNNLKKFLELVRGDATPENIKIKMFNEYIKYFSDSKGGISSVAGAGIKGAFNLLKTQEDSGIPTITDQLIKLSDAEKILLNNNNDLKSFSEIFIDLLKGAGDFLMNQVLLYLKEQNSLLEEINTKTSLTGKLSKDYREELSNVDIQLKLIGVGLNEIANASINLITQTGKFKLLNEETWVEGAKVAKAYLDNIDDFTNSVVAFEKVGYGARDTSKFLEAVSKSSIGVGIESRRVTKDLRENIGKLNEFGFKNGVQGLGEMIKKSIEFRANIKSTFDMANKLFDYNSALEMSANLQVLGGSIGDFADVHKLVYMARNDVEGLQDAIYGVGKELVTFQNGSYNIVGANVGIARDMADALKMDYQEFANIAVAANEKVQASTDLLGAKIGGKYIDDDLKEFLTNMAQMDNGELKITIPKNLQDVFNNKSEISLKDISGNEKLLQAFKEYQDQFKQLSKEEIIENQASSVKNIERYVSFMAASIRVKGGQAVSKLADAYGIDFLKDIKEYTKEFTKTDNGKVFGEAMINKISDIFKINIDKVRGYMNGDTTTKQNQAKEKEKEEANKKEAPISRNELTILIKNDSGVLLDAITREIVKDPSFAKTLKELIINENQNKV